MTGRIDVWFAGRRIWAEGRAVETDRPGSVRGASGACVTRYYPYGEEPVTTEQNRTKFATYYRDETTALDYADQRYYYRVIGRFLTADPYPTPAAVGEPQRWNQYAYAGNDPVNENDPTGLGPSDWSPLERCLFGIPWGTFPAQADAWARICGVLYGPAESYLWTAFQQIPPRPGRGGAIVYKIYVEGLSKSGRNQELILRRLSEILKRMDEDCAKWLSGYEPFIRGLLGEGLEAPLIAHGVFRGRPDIAAFIAGTDQDINVPPGYAAIVVNDAGAFFNARYGANQLVVAKGRFVGGTPAAQVVILIHEIAHGLGRLEPHINDRDAGKRNEELILRHCSRTVESFQ